MSVSGITNPEIEDAVEEYLISKNEPLDDETPAPIPTNEPTRIIADEQPKLSNTEIRRLRGLYMTVRHPHVAACGHKYVADKQPRHNCEDCWFAWMNSHGELVQTTDELFQTTGGVELIKQLRGSKFLKMFLRFMSTVANLKAQEAANVAQSQQETADGK